MPCQINKDTIPVRNREELNLPVLEQFLRDYLSDLPCSPLEVLQFSAGHSNLTYQLRMGDWGAVLRRPLSGMVGIFDWEMTTIGDPLADLGAAMSYWIEADDPDPLKRGLGLAHFNHFIKSLIQHATNVADYGFS